jgi:hypothetical protein
MSSRPSRKTKREKSKIRRRNARHRASPLGGGSQAAYGSLLTPAMIMPDSLFVKLKYVDQFVLNPTSASTDNYVFRANSLFDPNYTGTGHQPYGYDQWATFYSSWVVERCVLTFTCTPPNLSTAAPQIDNSILYIVKRRSDPNAFTDINTAIEDPFCVRYVMTTGYQKQPKLRVAIDCPTFFGVAKEVYLSSQEYSGATGSNPTIPLYLICGAGTTAAGTNNPDPMYCTAELTFFVKFYNAANLTGSTVSSTLKKCLPGIPFTESLMSSPKSFEGDKRGLGLVSLFDQ